MTVFLIHDRPDSLTRYDLDEPIRYFHDGLLGRCVRAWWINRTTGRREIKSFPLSFTYIEDHS